MSQGGQDGTVSVALWHDGNQGFYGFDQFNHYVESAKTPTSLVLIYDPLRGPPDPTVNAGRIEFAFSGYTSVLIENGPLAGTQQVTGGTVTGLKYQTANGALLLEIAQLNQSLPIILSAMARGDGAAVWQMITRATNTIIGSNDASGPNTVATGDVLDSGTGTDAVIALDGDDYLQDRGGTDTYNGGAGFDTVSYDGWYYRPWGIIWGLSADLVLGQVTGPDGAIDTLIGVEALNGTFLADLLKGNNGANSFAGFAGADRIDGRGGFDMVSYGREASQGGSDGIKVNLARGRVRDSFGYTDTLTSIEGVQGTAQTDTFTDNGADNFFSGSAGNDFFSFGPGNDTGRGGAGQDVFQFRGPAFGDDTIDDFSQAQGDLIQIATVAAFADLQISAVVINGVAASFVEFTGGNLTLLGVAAASLTAADFGL